MSADTITNFIQPIDTVISWAVGILQADGYWTHVERIDNYGYDQVFNVLASQQIPSCVVIYKGGSYQNQPRAKRTFSVFVAERDWVDKDDAEALMSATVTKVISLLDHELVNDRALVRVRSDKYIPLQWSGVTAYEIMFEIEDY